MAAVTSRMVGGAHPTIGGLTGRIGNNRWERIVLMKKTPVRSLSAGGQPSESHRRRLVEIAVAVLVVVAVVGFGFWIRQRSVDPDAVWSRAQASLKAGRFEEAEADLDLLGELREPTPSDWMLQAQVAVAQGRDDEAIDALKKIPDSHPLGSQARRMAGQIELRRNRMRFAEHYLLESLRLDPDQTQARRELVYIYGMQLRRKALGEQFRELSRRGPLTLKDVFLWSLTRGSVWEAKEQSAALRDYLDADPEDRWSRLALADSLMTLGHVDEIESVLEPLPNNDPEARARRAEVAIARGDLDRADALLADGPDDHPGLARLRGLLALRRRDSGAAIRYFRAAEATEPDDRETLFGLARAYNLAGETEKAAPYFQTAKALDTLATLVQHASTPEGKKDPALPRKVGRACEEAGRIAEARAWYGVALSLDPLNREIQQALYRLESRD